MCLILVFVSLMTFLLVSLLFSYAVDWFNANMRKNAEKGCSC